MPVSRTSPVPTSPVPAARAALVGLLSVLAALTAGHLVAGALLAPSASPYLAVGGAAIDRTPTPIRDFAIDLFGTADKVALLVGMAVVLGLLGIVAGLVSRRRWWPGLLLIAVLGVVGVLAVLEQSPAALAVAAPVASLLVGLGVFAGLHALARPARPAAAPENAAPPGDETARQDAAPEDAAPEDAAPADAGASGGGPRRRHFLVGSMGVAAASALAAVGGTALAARADIQGARRAIGALVPDVPAPPIPPGAAFPELGTPTFITPSAEFYRIDINLTPPVVRVEDAVLRITGLVDRPVTFTFDDIRSRRLVEQTITMVCVSNTVGGNLVSTSNFLGVPLAELLAEAGVRPEATQLLGRSVDGFTIGTPLQRVMDAGDRALLVIGMNREPLLVEHGFPMRTIVSPLYGYVSATKWLSELELTTFDVDPYWEQRGWDGDPDGIVPIKTSSRVDAPQGFAEVPAGEVTAVGTAWAPGRGIRRVEVRYDDGPWRDATLATEVNPFTWRMWRHTEVLRPGSHSITVRATDGNGELQPEERVEPINPGPDGATGWFQTRFSVV
ncbi:MAG: molybdopterin-dependent oxidoreductase [Pseudonocardia sp.]